MHKLVKLQLRNIFHSKFFYVCLILTILLSPTAEFFIQIFDKNAKISLVFPSLLTYFQSELDLTSKIFIAIFCCMDFNEGTTKNIIARGYTRTKLLFSKYIATLLGLSTMYLAVIVLTFAMFIKNGLGFDNNTILLLIDSFVYIIAATVMFSTISVVLEKSSSAIIACIFVPTIVSLGITLLDKNMHLDVGKFWIENASSAFRENPSFANLALPMLLYIAYIIVFIYGGINILKNKEIK